MRFKTLLLTATAFLISSVTPILADHHEPPPPPSKEDMFAQMDGNGDGMVTWDEFQAWYDTHHSGPMHGEGDPMHGDGGPMHGDGGPMHGDGGPMHGEGDMPPAPPECSEEMRQNEQQPQQTNVMASNGMQGNLLFRTICADMPGFDQVAISLPAGRQALDFDVEAITHSLNVVFGIRIEGGADVYHSSAGKAAFHSLNLGEGIYTIYLDTAASDPGARVTVRFIDTPQ